MTALPPCPTISTAVCAHAAAATDHDELATVEVPTQEVSPRTLRSRNDPDLLVCATGRAPALRVRWILVRIGFASVGPPSSAVPNR